MKAFLALLAVSGSFALAHAESAKTEGAAGAEQQQQQATEAEAGKEAGKEGGNAGKTN